MTQIWPIKHPPDLETLKRASELVRSGRLVAFPTETVYGIGAIPQDSELLERICALKGRAKTKPFSWHLSDPGEIGRLNLAPNPLFEKVLKNLLPGPLTALVKTVSGETIGIRLPEDRAAREFIRLLGGALLATSANPSGSPSPVTGREVLSYFEGAIDLVLDAGRTRFAGDSTVADFTCEPFKIIRAGVYSKFAVKVEKLK